jgi:hypothetical protein
MNGRLAKATPRSLLTIATLSCGAVALLFIGTSHATALNPKPEASASGEAFLQVYKLFTRIWIDGGAACPEQ